jgi:predicted RNase H-like nuclease (RuvC/YqgF family)
MAECDDLERRVVALEAELGEAAAARSAAEEQLAELESALAAAHEALAVLGDPLFARTFVDSRLPEVADLERRLARKRRRVRKLRAELEQLRASRTYRFVSWLGLPFRGRLDR